MPNGDGLAVPIEYLIRSCNRVAGFINYKWRNALLWGRKYIFNRKYGTGESILEFDWDNLILLDSCRYDEFIRLTSLQENKIDRRVTLASRTSNFLQKTFSDQHLHDTVYITANPQVIKFERERPNTTPTFHRVISLLDRWDGKKQTILPSEVTKVAIRTEKEHPNKRLIIHYLQPHAPFIGKKATEIRERTGKTIGGLSTDEETTNPDLSNIPYEENMLKNNDYYFDHNDLITAYRESLAIVLEEAIDLANELSGKTALTADHGELLGEYIHPLGKWAPLGNRWWSHPGRVRAKQLCIVPWAEFETDTRKEITTDPPEDTNYDTKEISEKLHALGYKS